ncbi:uncharacterized protein LOC127799499 [Diospyros lotus]|uniref:uncharacterized protein LOC127799499 n=1 Tax=Diospyros lotus TaxID=55363 RepID=UPI00224F4C3F|nr:uncharacterized protein LOC127799499 [Diospyros lotus]
MARANNGRRKWCSYKRTALIMCSINVGFALYVVNFLCTSLYTYSYRDSPDAVVEYTPDQIRRMEESIRLRKTSEPVKLIKLVKAIENEILSEEITVALPKHLKQKIADEILERLRMLSNDADSSQQQEAVESWRKEKLEETERLALGETSNSTLLPEEAGMLARALKSNWRQLSEEVGLWIPDEIDNEEHDDKPEGATDPDEEVLPGRPLPPECHAEYHADYGGAAVRWGLTHPKESAFECCQACLDQARRAKPGEMKCNIWVYCPQETGCHSPDIYQHRHMECWLKYAEKPKVTFKDKYSEAYRRSHPNAPEIVPWIAGVVTA